MAKKTVSDIEVKSQRVLTRVDFNVPQDDEGNITDDRRIRMALPTLRNVLDRGGRLILMSHLGRPKGKDRKEDQKWTLSPVERRLGELLRKPVSFAADCVGPEAQKVVAGLQDGDCCLLENLRFHAAEQIKDKDAAKDPDLRKRKDEFAGQLAELADVYVNDAFGTCHRDNASMLTVPRRMEGKPRVAGFLLEKELQFLGDALNAPKRPFVAILGGAKVSDKIGVIEALLDKCDSVLIGGAMMFTFWLSQGLKTGKSLVEPDKVDEAKRLLGQAGEKLKLPVDFVAAAEIKADAATQVLVGDVPEGLLGLDVGPKTVETFSKFIGGAKTIVWNGPMGVFELDPFAQGTFAVAKAVAAATKSGAVSVIGGGDSAAAIEKAGLSEQVSHVSTGGGASLEFLEGKSFKAVEVLDER